jgi:hypothetical protein
MARIAIHGFGRIGRAMTKAALTCGPPTESTAGMLQGFFFIGGPIASAIERELVPPEQMGRWLGVNRSFRMVLSAILVLAAGIVWDRMGPHYIFLGFVGIDLLMRVPLLITIPETLHRNPRRQASPEEREK